LTSSTQTADRLHSAAIHLLRGVRGSDPETGLSPARLSALSVLVFGGPRTLTELAHAEQVRTPTMSAIVGGLEAEGLVRRRPHPRDRRSAVLHATAKGIRLLERGRRRRIETLAARLEGLGRDELRTLSAAAEIMERVFGQPHAPNETSRGPRA
jgi:DNA-binding MarR family transcriptional regulator